MELVDSGVGNGSCKEEEMNGGDEEKPDNETNAEKLSLLHDFFTNEEGREYIKEFRLNLRIPCDVEMALCILCLPAGVSAL